MLLARPNPINLFIVRGEQQRVDDYLLVRTIQLKPETPRVEDYLEAIYRQVQERGYTSTIDLADKLQVKPPTVSIMLRKLDRDGYLMYEPYRGMKLTEKGEKVAISVISRHRVISEFLSIIGVAEREAQHDAEGIEHHVLPTTVHKIERLVEFLRKNEKSLNAIRDYTRT